MSTLNYLFFNGMGLQRFFRELATRPQLKQMAFGLAVSTLISSNRSSLASTHRCPLCEPLQTALFMPITPMMIFTGVYSDFIGHVSTLIPGPVGHPCACSELKHGLCIWPTMRIFAPTKATIWRQPYGSQERRRNL